MQETQIAGISGAVKNNAEKDLQAAVSAITAQQTTTAIAAELKVQSELIAGRVYAGVLDEKAAKSALLTAATMYQTITVTQANKVIATAFTASFCPYGGWTEPAPFSEALPDVPTFPVEILPPGIQEWVSDAAHRFDNSPPDYMVAVVLSAVGNLIGRRCGIMPKAKDNWVVVPNLWGMIVGRPSVRKSAMLSEGTRFIRAIENRERDRFEVESAQYNIELMADKLMMQAAENDAKKAAKEGRRNEVARILEEAQSQSAQPPQNRRLTLFDSTLEKLMELQQDNPMGLLMCRDELAGFLGAMTKEDKQADRAYYLEGWDGNKGSSYDRIGRGSHTIKSNTLGILGGIQPGKLEKYIQSMVQGDGDDGLLQRFQLMVYPDTCGTRRTDRAENPVAIHRAQRAFDAIDQLPEHDGGEIPALSFDAEGQAEYYTWYDRTAELIKNEPCEHMASHLSKYFGLYPSLALIFQVIDDADQGKAFSTENKVSSFCAARAGVMCEYLEHHARRVYSTGLDPFAAAKHLKDQLQRLPNPFKVRQVKDRSLALLKTTEEIKTALRELELNGYVAAAETKGKGRPSISYYINPAALNSDD